MRLGTALEAAGFGAGEIADILARVQPAWGGARLYLSHASVRRRRRGMPPRGAAERFMVDLERAVRDRDRYKPVELHMMGCRIDVDSDFFGPRTPRRMA